MKSRSHPFYWKLSCLFLIPLLFGCSSSTASHGNTHATSTASSKILTSKNKQLHQAKAASSSLALRQSQLTKEANILAAKQQASRSSSKVASKRSAADQASAQAAAQQASQEAAKKAQEVSAAQTSVEEEKRQEATNSQPSSTNSGPRGDMNTAETGQIIGNRNSKIYHVPGQSGYRMNSANAVTFDTEAQAQAAGYRKALR